MALPNSQASQAQTVQVAQDSDKPLLKEGASSGKKAQTQDEVWQQTIDAKLSLRPELKEIICHMLLNQAQLDTMLKAKHADECTTFEGRIYYIDCTGVKFMRDMIVAFLKPFEHILFHKKTAEMVLGVFCYIFRVKPKGYITHEDQVVCGNELMGRPILKDTSFHVNTLLPEDISNDMWTTGGKGYVAKACHIMTLEHFEDQGYVPTDYHTTVFSKHKADMYVIVPLPGDFEIKHAFCAEDCTAEHFPDPQNKKLVSSLNIRMLFQAKYTSEADGVEMPRRTSSLSHIHAVA
jgi:hypothetical protein